MKVRLRNGQTHEYPDGYAARMIEQGQAVPVKAEKKAAKAAPKAEKKAETKEDPNGAA